MHSICADAYPTQIPIKEGYKFLGWAKSKDAAEPNVTKDTVINSEGPREIESE